MHIQKARPEVLISPERDKTKEEDDIKRTLTMVMMMVFAVSGAFASDIVDTVVSAGQFNTLVAAAKAAGLVDTLKSAGPFTVFAPTEEAFAKLPAGTVENLFKKPEQLKQVLQYHVVAGKVMAADVVKVISAKTVQGPSAKVTVAGGLVKIDSANVVKTDIECDNGVIHVIDTVILPKQ